MFQVFFLRSIPKHNHTYSTWNENLNLCIYKLESHDWSQNIQMLNQRIPKSLFFRDVSTVDWGHFKRAPSSYLSFLHPSYQESCASPCSSSLARDGCCTNTAHADLAAFSSLSFQGLWRVLCIYGNCISSIHVLYEVWKEAISISPRAQKLWHLLLLLLFSLVMNAPLAYSLYCKTKRTEVTAWTFTQQTLILYFLYHLSCPSDKHSDKISYRCEVDRHFKKQCSWSLT